MENFRLSVEPDTWRAASRVAEQAWRKLNAPEWLPLVASGVPFKEGRMIRSGSVTRDGNNQSDRTAPEPHLHIYY